MPQPPVGGSPYSSERQNTCDVVTYIVRCWKASSGVRYLVDQARFVVAGRLRRRLRKTTATHQSRTRTNRSIARTKRTKRNEPEPRSAIAESADRSTRCTRCTPDVWLRVCFVRSTVIKRLFCFASYFFAANEQFESFCETKETQKKKVLGWFQNRNRATDR